MRYSIRLFAVPILILLFSCRNLGDFQCRKWVKNNLPQEKYSGIIVRKFIDTPDKAMSKFVLEDSSIYYFYNNDMFLKAKPGDVVIKKEGTLKYSLVDNADTFVYYPICDSVIKDF